MLRVAVVTNMFPTPDDPTQGTFVHQQVKGLTDAGIEVRIVHFDRRGRGMTAYRNIGSVVQTCLREYAPDIVHCMYGGMLANVTTRSVRGEPVVVSYCGSDLFGEAVGSPFRRFVGAYRVRASQRAARRASAIIVKSEGLGAALHRSIDRRKVFVLPNGVDLNRFRPLDREECRRQIGWEDDRFHVLFTNGNGDPRKRLELARTAVDQLWQQGIRAELNVIPRVPHSEVPVWMNAADAVVLTSIHEGSPNVIKEALACNRPIVSVDVGDVKERVAGVDGCHVVEAAPEKIAAALFQVYSGPRVAMGRVKVQCLSLEATAVRLIDIYRWAIDQHRAVAPKKMRARAATSQ